MKPAVLVGYAALEYAVQLDGAFRGDWTVPIKHRHDDPWPRPGGCHFYAARPIAQAGGAPALVSWIGEDELGALYRRYCEEHGIGTQGLAVMPGTTPLCILVYQPDGSCGCLIDFGMSSRSVITADQEKLIAEADLVCVTVGPAPAVARALELLRPQATVAWITKNDPASFTPEIRRTLAQRADVIFCNVRERAWVDEVRATRPVGQAIVQTSGAGSVQVHQSGRVTELAVSAVPARDTTGAGDTLAGGTLAALLAGEPDVVVAVRAGIDAAHALLKQRIEKLSS